MKTGPLHQTENVLPHSILGEVLAGISQNVKLHHADIWDQFLQTRTDVTSALGPRESVHYGQRYRVTR